MDSFELLIQLRLVQTGKVDSVASIFREALYHMGHLQRHKFEGDLLNLRPSFQFSLIVCLILKDFLLN